MYSVLILRYMVDRRNVLLRISEGLYHSNIAHLPVLISSAGLYTAKR